MNGQKQQMKALGERKRRGAPLRGLESRFSVPVTPAVNFRAAEPAEFEQLKDKLLRDQLASETHPEVVEALRRAANDAAGLAWTMPLPLLVLPELFREKVAFAKRYARRQAALRRGERPVGKTSEFAA